MFAVSPAPSSSFSRAAGDGGLLLKFQHPQQSQPRPRLGPDQVATSSSFPSEGGPLHHTLEVASSLSSFSTLSRSSSDGSLLPLHQHHHSSHGFSSQSATHVQSLACAVNRAGYGAHHHNRHGGLSPQAATHSLSSRAVSGGLLHHHRQPRQYGLRIPAAVSPPYPSLGACAGNGNLLPQEQNHLCLTLPSTFCGLLQQQQSCPRLQAHSQQQLIIQKQQERLLRQQQKQEIKKHLEDILESIAEDQKSDLDSTNSQIDPNARGYLPPEIDISSCRSVFVGNVHHRVTPEFLGEVFSTVGTLTGCKLIRKPKSSYGIVDYSDHRAAAGAIATLNGRQLFGLPIKVNWAYLKEQREDKKGHHTIFVGDLGEEITDAALFTLFSTYPSCSGVRVMWNPRNARTKGFGFVSFKEREDAEKAIEEMTGKMLGSRAIRCNWATQSEGGDEGHEATSKTERKNDYRFTTVYVGNLTQEVTEDELQKEFDMLGVGVIERVLIPKEKNFGFVRYSSHEEAALAISSANGKIIGGKPVVCSWGTKRNPPEASSESRARAPLVQPAEEVLPHEEAKAEG